MSELEHRFQDMPIPTSDAPAAKPVDAMVDTKPELVDVEQGGNVLVRMQYPRLGKRNAVSSCLVRPCVRDMLHEASRLLPDGCKLVVLDAWRPLALQRELFDDYSEQIIQKYALQDASDERREDVIRSFVSEPSDDVLLPFVHGTGGAVDVSMADEHGTELDMGTGFDSLSPVSSTSFFENASCDARRNRRLLYWAMLSVGFTNLNSEWWHFDYGDAFWGHYTDSAPMFRGIQSINGNIEHPDHVRVTGHRAYDDGGCRYVRLRCGDTFEDMSFVASCHADEDFRWDAAMDSVSHIKSDGDVPWEFFAMAQDRFHEFGFTRIAQ